MGEGEGGGGQYEDLLVLPPLHLLPPRRGEIFGRTCLINYGLLSNFTRLQSALDNVMRKKPLTMEALVFLPDGVGGSASLDPPYDEYAHSVPLQFALADDSQIR